MLIKKLILKEYKRLMLNNIKEFIYEPNSNFQLILGTNGSGKSSVLRELSPLPAFSGDYTKEGSKTIELEENNNLYILTSSFKNGNKHTFIRNGEVLNDEGTGSVQKELVEKYFNYTQELHDLLIGDISLTEMAPNKRREWFTKLSPNDLSYAISIYNNIKARHRDTQGAYNHVNKRLTAETNNLLALTDIENIDNRVELLKKDIILFLENKDSQFNIPNNTEIELFNVLNEIENISNNIIKKRPSSKLGLFSNFNELEERKNILEDNYKLSLNKLEMKTSEYADMEKLLASINRIGVDGIDGLKKKISDLDIEIVSLKSKVKLFNEISDVETIYLKNDDVIYLVESALQELPSNENNYFSREKISEHENKLSKLKETILSIRMTKGRSEERYEYVNSAKDIECPKCNHIWKPGISEHELVKLKDRIEECNKNLLSNEEDFKLANDYLLAAENYISTWKRFKNVVDNNTSFFKLWNYLLEDNLVTKSPKKAISSLYIWKEDIDLLFNIKQLEKEKDNIQKAYDAAAHLEAVSGISAFQERLNIISNEVSKLTDKCLIDKESLSNINELYSSAQYILNEYNHLNKLLERLEYLFLDYQKGIKNVILNNGIGELNSSLGQIQNKLNEKTTLENLINDLTNDSNNLDLDYICYKNLMEELSPVNGLIADQLYGNISCVISQMNEIINQIWTYDLEVLSCGQESNELDYKFPLQVRSANNIVQDISKGSTAQVEVVNFAFKLVVMLYLNLSNYPLYLDEIGHSFDEQHRANIMNYIKLLIESKRHSQLFMISHYAPQYGAMTQAEICVLDSSNISMPFIHNKHVIMR